MLDKTIPYYDIIMETQLHDVINVPSLPEGYRFKMYEDGDEAQWAYIECMVDEFSTKEDALAYFHKTFLPYKQELSQRMIFVLDQDNHYVATTTAWYINQQQERLPLLHWVACLPLHQNKGIARCMVTYALSLFLKVEDSRTVYLHTQTWSYKAVYLYESLNFTYSEKQLKGVVTHPEANMVVEKQRQGNPKQAS